MKTLVVGGGPAGLSAAEKASDIGRDVVLYDKDGYGDKSDRWNAWGGFVGDIGKVRQLNGDEEYISEIDELIWNKKNGEKFKVEMDDAATIDRRKTERLWAQRLENKGVEIRNKEVDAGKVISLSESFDLMIDCSGAMPISCKLNNIEAPSRAATGMSANIEGDFSDFYGQMKVFPFGRDYLYVIPQSESRGTVGAGGPRTADLGEIEQRIKKRCREEDIPVPEDFQTRLMPVAGGRSYPKCEYTINDMTVRLAGDATSNLNGLVGFGFDRACEQGEMAVKTDKVSDSYPKWLKKKYRSSRLQKIMFDRIHDELGHKFIVKLLGNLPGTTTHRLIDPDSTLELLDGLRESVYHRS